jgi:hypothetical protein
VWLPARAALRVRLMVFKCICGSSVVSASTCAFIMAALCVIQDHPAYIPRLAIDLFVSN